MTLDVRAINLDYLRRTLLDEAPATGAAMRLTRAAVRGKPTRDLGKLLRHHADRPVAWAEVWLRDGFDNVISFYSTIEAGIIAGALPPELPAKYADAARAFLEYPAIVTYYEKNYPLALPVMLRERLNGAPLVAADIHDGDDDLFALFLEVNRPVERDGDLGTFLWFVDSGLTWDRAEEDYVDVDDTIDVLRDPERFFKAMVGPARNGKRRRTRSPLDKSVVGFSRYLDFCRAFERLLEGSAEAPYLQAAFWHYHAYWFVHAADALEDALTKGISAFAKWKADVDDLSEDPEADRRQLASYHSAREQLIHTVHALTSGEYGELITELLPSDLQRRLGGLPSQRARSG